MTNTLERRILPRRVPATITHEINVATQELMRYPTTSRMHKVWRTRRQALTLELALSTGALSIGAI